MVPDFGSAAIKMIGSLLLILGLIICLFYLLKRLRPGSFSTNKYPEMRLIRILQVAPKRSLALVEVLDEWLLVGIGTESVALISKYHRPPESDTGDNIIQSDGQGFLSLLQKKGTGKKWRKKRGIKKNENS